MRAPIFFAGWPGLVRSWSAECFKGQFGYREPVIPVRGELACS